MKSCSDLRQTLAARFCFDMKKETAVTWLHRVRSFPNFTFHETPGLKTSKSQFWIIVIAPYWQHEMTAFFAIYRHSAFTNSFHNFTAVPTVLQWKRRGCCYPWHAWECKGPFISAWSFNFIYYFIYYLLFYFPWTNSFPASGVYLQGF